MRSANALSAHRFLIRTSLGAVQAFVWIFIWQFFFNTTHDLRDASVHVVLLYGLSQVVTILATPIAAQTIIRGVRRQAMLSTAVLAAALVSAAAALVAPADLFAPIIVAFPLFLGLYRALYWIPYRVAHEAVLPQRASVSPDFFIAFIPAIIGFTLYRPEDAVQVLIAAAIIAIASIAPLATSTEVCEKFAWGYRETFGELIEPRFKQLVQSSLLFGFEAAALLFVWPLFVYLFIARSYALFGIILTASLLLSILVKAYGRRVLKTDSVLARPLVFVSWIFRIFAGSPFTVILVDVYAGALPHLETNDQYAREQAADNATYVDELTALKEISYALGRLTMAIVLALGITYLGVPFAITLVFILAATAALCAMTVAQRTF